jgi:hypothetical protein
LPPETDTRYHPGNGNSSLQDPFDHLDCQFGLGLEAHRCWNTSHSTAIAILTPVPGQREFAINEGVPFRRHIPEKDPDLTILDLSCRSTILQGNACRVLAPFGKAGFIDDQESALPAQLLQSVGAKGSSRTPSLSQTALERRRCIPSGPASLACSAGLPTVFALRFTHYSLQIGQRPPTWLRASKARSNTSTQTQKALGPTADISGSRSACDTWVLLLLLHELLLSMRSLKERDIHLYRVSHRSAKFMSFFYTW